MRPLTFLLVTIDCEGGPEMKGARLFWHYDTPFLRLRRNSLFIHLLSISYLYLYHTSVGLTPTPHYIRTQVALYKADISLFSKISFNQVK